NVEVFDTDRDTTTRGISESEVFQAVQEFHGRSQATAAIGLEDELAEGLLLHLAVLEPDLLRDDGVEQHATDRRVDPTRTRRLVDQELDRRLILDVAKRDRHLDLIGRGIASRVLDRR